MKRHDLDLNCVRGVPLRSHPQRTPRHFLLRNEDAVTKSWGQNIPTKSMPHAPHMVIIMACPHLSPSDGNVLLPHHMPTLFQETKEIFLFHLLSSGMWQRTSPAPAAALYLYLTLTPKPLRTSTCCGEAPPF